MARKKIDVPYLPPMYPKEVKKTGKMDYSEAAFPKPTPRKKKGKK